MPMILMTGCWRAVTTRPRVQGHAGPAVAQVLAPVGSVAVQEADVVAGLEDQPQVRLCVAEILKLAGL